MNIFQPSPPCTIFEDTGYRGLKMELTVGSYSNIGLMGFPNDAISSIKVGHWTEVTIYEDSAFRGRSYTITGPKEIPDLSRVAANWGLEDSVTSLKVVAIAPPLTKQMACCKGTDLASTCAEFQPGSGACEAAMGLYCTADKLGEPQCQEWCSTNNCDGAVVEYCQKHPEDVYCSCVLSTVAAKNIVNPKCVDETCLRHGYLTQNMRQTLCPTVINCDMQVAIEQSGTSVFSSIPLEQNCGVDANTTQTVTETRSSASESNWLLYLLLFVLVIMIALAAFPDDDNDSTTSQHSSWF